MPDLTPVTALGDAGPRARLHGALQIEENTGLALASLALRRNAPAPSPFGLALPGPGGFVADGAVSAFWTGPDQWMIEGHGRADSDFAAELAALCPGCSVTEQTDGFVAFEIRSSSGETPILALMAKLVNIDPARLAAGSATRTGLFHLSAFAIRRAPDRLAIIGPRSAAQTMWHGLETALQRLADTVT